MAEKVLKRKKSIYLWPLRSLRTQNRQEHLMSRLKHWRCSATKMTQQSLLFWFQYEPVVCETKRECFSTLVTDGSFETRHHQEQKCTISKLRLSFLSKHSQILNSFVIETWQNTHVIYNNYILIMIMIVLCINILTRSTAFLRKF